MSYLRNFDFTKTHFDNVPAGGPFHPEESDKIVWQYPHLEYISTSECYASALMSVSVRSNLVEGDEELGVYIVPANSESINSDTSTVQWKELKANDSIDNVGFRIVQPNGELVSYQSGNIFLSIFRSIYALLEKLVVANHACLVRYFVEIGSCMIERVLRI